MINILLAINSNQVEAFLDNWRFDADGNRVANDFAPFNAGNDLSTTIDVYKPAFFSVANSAQGGWRENTSGSSNKKLVTVYVADIVEPDWADPSDPDPKDILTVIHYLRETFPGSVQILEAFKRDGTRHGQTLVPATYDDESVELTPESVEGTATYNANPQADSLEYMPDDVTYDVDGVETSRTAATQLKEVNKLFGWSDRKW